MAWNKVSAIKIHCTELDSMIHRSERFVVIKLIRFFSPHKKQPIIWFAHCFWNQHYSFYHFQRKFYGIDDSFPADQLLVRSVGGKKRNIYLVSKTVKDVMKLIDDNHKVCCITLGHGNSLLQITTQAILPKFSCNLI